MPSKSKCLTKITRNCTVYVSAKSNSSVNIHNYYKVARQSNGR